MADKIFIMDAQILLWIQENIRNPILSSILIPITKLGNAGILFIVTGIVLLCFRKTRKAGTLFLTSLVLNFILNDLVIKNVIERQRPFEVIKNLEILVPPPYSFSFPSGHTSSAFASLVTLFFTQKKFAPFGLAFAVLMGFSRMYVGVHYLSDVLAGAVVGTVVALITVYFGYVLQFVKKCDKM